jgi:hypothetical protein
MSSTTTRRFTQRPIKRAVPALLLALAVLVLGVAGTATAAKLITGNQIKNNTVSTKDIKNGTVKQKDLNKSVNAKLNAPSVKGYQVVTATETVPTAGQTFLGVACPLGKVVQSGGSTWEDTSIETATISSAPRKVIRGDALLYAEPDPGFADGWAVEARHNGLDPQDLTVYAICVSPN